MNWKKYLKRKEYKIIEEATNVFGFSRFPDTVPRFLNIQPFTDTTTMSIRAERNEPLWTIIE